MTQDPASAAQRGPSPRLRLLVAGLFAVALAVTAWLVWNPSADVPTNAVYRVSEALRDAGVPDLLSGTDLIEFCLNVALFVPLTFLAALLWWRVPGWTWVLIGFTASAVIEAVQLGMLDARSAQVRDLVSNTLGAGIGGGLAVALRRRGAGSRWLGERREQR